MIMEPAALDRMFHALSDRSRRGMVDRLGRGPASVMELAKPLSMTLPTVMKHLSVLESSGLVQSEKAGRVRTYRLQQDALGHLDRWISEKSTKLT
jgi:DNA-binding transcriptional ArsR family regulator